jgi:uncharacterized membrane protein YgaE (UPF0421/DUF939 family)
MVLLLTMVAVALAGNVHAVVVPPTSNAQEESKTTSTDEKIKEIVSRIEKEQNRHEDAMENIKSDLIRVEASSSGLADETENQKKKWLPARVAMVLEKMPKSEA